MKLGALANRLAEIETDHGDQIEVVVGTQDSNVALYKAHSAPADPDGAPDGATMVLLEPLLDVEVASVCPEDVPTAVKVAFDAVTNSTDPTPGWRWVHDMVEKVGCSPEDLFHSVAVLLVTTNAHEALALILTDRLGLAQTATMGHE